jgi:hypothetical protein
MNCSFSPEVVEIGDSLTAMAGSYLHTVDNSPQTKCEICALPVEGYPRCPQCNSHAQGNSLTADRTGYLVYAEKHSQTYKAMQGYKENGRTRVTFESVVKALLAVGLRGHFVCAGRKAPIPVGGWAVVPSTNDRPFLRDLVHGMSRGYYLEVKPIFVGDGPTRELNAKSWKVDVSEPVPNHVVVIEDSWVTGATAQSVAGALKEAGADQVSILTIARVLAKDWGPNKRFLKEVLPSTPYNWKVCPWTRGHCPPR